LKLGHKETTSSIRIGPRPNMYTVIYTWTRVSWSVWFPK